MRIYQETTTITHACYTAANTKAGSRAGSRPASLFTGLSGEQTPKPNKHKSKLGRAAAQIRKTSCCRSGPGRRSGRPPAARPGREADPGRKISGTPAGANSSAGNDRIITRRPWKRYSGHFLREIDPIRVKNPYNHPGKGKSRGTEPRTGENPPFIPSQAAEEKTARRIEPG